MLLFRPFGFKRSGVKLCSVLPSVDILIHDEITSGEYHKSWLERLVNGGSSLCVVEELAWCSGLHSRIEAATQVKFRVFAFRVISACVLAFVYYYFLGGVAYGEPGLKSCLGGGGTVGLEYCSGASCFFSFSNRVHLYYH
jgi:hypothetical protein